MSDPAHLLRHRKNLRDRSAGLLCRLSQAWAPRCPALEQLRPAEPASARTVTDMVGGHIVRVMAVLTSANSIVSAVCLLSALTREAIASSISSVSGCAGGSSCAGCTAASGWLPSPHASHELLASAAASTGWAAGWAAAPPWGCSPALLCCIGAAAPAGSGGAALAPPQPPLPGGGELAG